jgi:hypothetical protein
MTKNPHRPFRKFGMRSLRLTICIAALVSATALLAVSSARANGYWNVPSTFCQCMGVGWGAGYHAPFVLGPITWHEWCDHKEVRLPYAPAPPNYYGHAAYGYQCGQPSRLESSEIPQPQPQTMPTYAPPRAIFEPPVEP